MNSSETTNSNNSSSKSGEICDVESRCLGGTAEQSEKCAFDGY